MIRLGLGVAIATLAFGSIGHAQTNLLTNGSFENPNGFSEFANTVDAFTNSYNFAGFQSWPGWDTDFADDGLTNGTWDMGTPGGFMFDNFFPASETAPVLTGAGSGVALGPFNLPNTTTGAGQQVAVTPGDLMQITVWGRIDSTTGDDTIFESGANQFINRFEYIDPATGTPDVFAGDGEETIFDAANQTLPEVDQMWIESVLTTTVPTGATILRQLLLFNQFDFDENGEPDPGVAYFDTASIVNLSTGTPLNGDYDYDGELTDDDVNMLSLLLADELVPVDESRFDFDGNEVVNQADLDALNAAIGPGLSADFNGDGTVDLLDLDILGMNFGMNGTQAEGDATGDGVVDLLDLDELGMQFGQGGSSSAVPEPAAVLLIALGVAPLLGRRR